MKRVVGLFISFINFFINSNRNDFYPIIDYYGEDETNDMLNVSDPSELINI